MRKKGTALLCGIDEAGRGCLAGPLVVAGVILKKELDGLDDSKKLTEKRREELFDIIKENSSYHIVFTESSKIDEVGLSRALADSIEEIVKKLRPSHTIMDGNTNFGVLGVTPVIKADTKIKEVSAASIMAKVSRDRYMVDIDEKYPQYGFKKHKGYGTKYHVEKIREFGRSDMHRYSFFVKGIDE